MDLGIDPQFHPEIPVDVAPALGDKGGPSPGIALCLSGGGYRAMLFHTGALLRLNQLGYFQKLNRVSSVSGGSITAGVLALAWKRLRFDSTGVAREFDREVVRPVRDLAGRTIDVKSILGGIFSPSSIGEKVASAYDRYLFKGATLQDLPEESPGAAPRFVINASNVQSGALYRFSRPHIWDYRVGRIDRPTLALSKAVAASSAFPPVLSPLTLKFKQGDYADGTGNGLQVPPYTTSPVLTDGGVYDNLGLETAWKRYRTILVSDGGGRMGPESEPKKDWAQHSKRVLDLVDNQVRSLRKRQVINSFKLPRDGGAAWRDGTYWGIRTDIGDYGLGDALPCPHEKTMQLAGVATRLAELDAVIQERLINWGYAVCDAALRRWVLGGPPSAPSAFPYPGAGVG